MSDANGATPSPATNGASADPQGGASQEPQSADLHSIVNQAISQALKPFTDKISKIDTLEARVSDHGKQFGKLKEKTNTAATAEPSADKQSGTQPMGPLQMIKLGRTLENIGKVNPKMAERIEAALSDGRDVSAMLEIAELVVSGESPATGEKAGATPAPPGIAASAAPRSSQEPHPRNRIEFMELMAAANERYTFGQNKGGPTEAAVKARRRLEALEKDPNFDPGSLPHH